MCTGTYVEADISEAGNGMQRPAEGTRCTEACVVEDGRWGASWCYTDDGDGTMASRQWGAECLQCTGTYVIHELQNA